MAETVLSLAKSGLDGVLGKLGSAAADEVAKMLGVRQEVRYIKGELEMMQSFLRVAESQQKNNEILGTWFRQVKDLAYQIEDCLELFSLHLENRSLCYRLWTLSTRRQIASNIRNIRVMVEEVSQRNVRYNLIKPLNLNHDASSKYPTLATRSMDALLVKETELVGQLKPKKDLIDMINDGSERRKVICLAGMGGLGKTTLARKVYDSKELSGFTPHVWVTVSQEFNTADLLMKILKEILGDKNVRMTTPERLLQQIKNELENKKYLVVLDDLWTPQAWSSIEKVFHDNNNGNRILITTRNKNVVEDCKSNHEIFLLEPLSSEDSHDLLLRKLNKSSEFFVQHKDLRQVVDKIIEKCKGLPLALITIGGLLARKRENKEEWEMLMNRIGSELETDAGAEHLKQILDLSYVDLPYYLKPCLLYLSIFPEDYELERNMVVYRWMAEGFVRERRGMTLEEVGKEYFNELVSRSLIQPSWTWNDYLDRWMKRYRVHDIMRELIVTKSIDENLIFITSEQGNMAATGNFRHLVVTDSTKFQGNESSIRSVSIFSGGEVPDLLLSSSSKFNLLRACHFDYGAYGFEQVVRRLPQFGNLKYISTSVYVSGFPKFIEKLRNLQTIKVDYVDASKFNFSRLHKLRHLINKGWRLNQGIRNLKELQTLSYINIGDSHPKVVEELAELHQLKRLEVFNLRKSQFKSFSASLSGLSCLRRLDLSIDEELDEAADGFLDSVSSPPEHLRSIAIDVWIGKLPTWFSQLVNLKKIYLEGTKLDEDAMVVFQRLHSLTFLDLGPDAYVGTKLIFANNTFSKLRVLRAWRMTKLEEVFFEEHSLPELEILHIGCCNLVSGINGIEKNLSRIKKIKLDRVKVPNLAVVKKAVSEHPNHPELVCEDVSELASNLTIIQTSNLN